MNSVKHKIGKIGNRVLSQGLQRVSGELYPFYLVPIMVLLCAGIVVVFLEWSYISGGHTFTVGSPSPYSYVAVSPMTYTDVTLMDDLRDRAEKSVASVMVRDVGASERMRLRLSEFRAIRDWTSPMKNFPERLLSAFRNLSDDRRETLLSSADSVGAVYFAALASEDAGALREEKKEEKAVLWAEIEKMGMTAAEENLLYQLLEEVADPSYKADPELTKIARDAAKKTIPSIERRLEAGKVIVEQGQTVTPQIARLLRLQGYSEDEFPLSQVIVLCLLMCVLPFWLEISAKEISGSRPTGSCVVFVIGTGWLCEVTATRLGVIGAGILPAVTMAYLCMPRRFAFNVCLAGTISVVFLITGLSIYNILSLLVFGFVLSISGFYVLHKIGSRENLGYKVLTLAVLFAAAKIFIRKLQGFPVTWESLSLSWPLGETWRVFGQFLFFDLVVTYLVIALLPMIEGYIGVLSILRTRELSHPSSLLLRKLQVEAPGTYHHSLMIGALAETVADDLGMDENLVKVGAYYHDIGKLRRPRFFVENQLGGENIHDTMSPTLSAVAIIAHVREGIELANEFGLPKKVKEFITEHHGTTCLTYFYKKALALGEKVEAEQFCYPGPKPRSRETALLMLLDSLEAAMRAESKNISTVKDIREIIERVVATKITGKQLDEVDFTFREIDRIKSAMLKAFQSMYHTRTVKEIK
ncbi:MAG: HDIG domain-containing protein [Synergistaceae bacterium]|jgi:putative nucleotidyltransferase with HDIG domain|nr:HDIG domain-containing protein [Synergistaceae bacterium]